VGTTVNTVATKPKLTAEERRERWWSRHPFPCYVYSKDRYGESVFLIQSREDLIAVAFGELKHGHELSHFGREDWFFSGTYEEFVQQEIGLSVEDADRLLMGPEPTVHELKQLKARYTGLKRQFLEEGESIRTLKTVHAILNGEVEPLAAIDVLLNRNWTDTRSFEIRQFNEIGA
jgi:hypothetical protein